MKVKKKLGFLSFISSFFSRFYSWTFIYTVRTCSCYRLFSFPWILLLFVSSASNYTLNAYHLFLPLLSCKWYGQPAAHWSVDSSLQSQRSYILWVLTHKTVHSLLYLKVSVDRYKILGFHVFSSSFLNTLLHFVQEWDSIFCNSDDDLIVFLFKVISSLDLTTQRMLLFWW